MTRILCILLLINMTLNIISMPKVSHCIKNPTLTFCQFTEKDYEATIKERTFKCPIEGCNNSYATQRILRKHILKKHKNTILSCPYRECSKKCLNEHELNEHIRKLHDPNRFKCCVPECNQTFSHKTNMYRHLRKIHHLISIKDESDTLSKFEKKLDFNDSNDSLEDFSFIEDISFDEYIRNYYLENPHVIQPLNTQLEDCTNNTTQNSKTSTNFLDRFSKSLERNNSEAQVLLERASYSTIQQFKAELLQIIIKYNRIDLLSHIINKQENTNNVLNIAHKVNFQHAFYALINK